MGDLDDDDGLPPPSKSTIAPGGTPAGTPDDTDDGLPRPSRSTIAPGTTRAGPPDDMDDGLPPPSRSTIVPRTPPPRLPIAKGLVAIAGGLLTVAILIATGVVPTGLSANRPVGGGSGKHVQFFLEGHVTSRSGCQGEYYSAAPQVGESGNFLGEMWLVGGVLYSTDTSASNSLYRGSLHNDGSFQLVWTQATPNGEKQRIDGVIVTNGKSITGTFDTVFLSGCLLHNKIDRGDLLSNATIGTLRG